MGCPVGKQSRICIKRYGHSSCSIHIEMVSHVVKVDHKYSGTSGGGEGLLLLKVFLIILQSLKTGASVKLFWFSCELFFCPSSSTPELKYVKSRQFHFQNAFLGMKTGYTFLHLAMQVLPTTQASTRFCNDCLLTDSGSGSF